MSSKYLIGDSSSVQTPKGLNEMSNVGLHLSLYIANFKGGRNESFMYGVDTSTMWYDYDLVSAYTTAMACLGHPDYEHGELISQETLSLKSFEEILWSYTIMKGKFTFPKSTKFPSIPCYVGDATVYPLKGECVLTGPEYLLAKKQGCKLVLSEIFYLPFVKDVNGGMYLTSF